MDEVKPKRSRIPNSRMNSEYSVAETARVRTALKALMHRHSKSAEAVLDEMASILPDELKFAFKDRGQIYEFLRGAEPFDPKIEAITEYLALTDPDLSVTINDNEFVQMIGNSFSKFFLPHINVSKYENLIKQQVAAEYDGVYLCPAEAGFLSHNTSTILLIRHIPKTIYARCDFYRLSINSIIPNVEESQPRVELSGSEERKRQQLYDQLTSKKFTDVRINKNHVREKLSDKENEEFSKMLDFYLGYLQSLGLTSLLRIAYSGICLMHPEDGSGYFLCRYGLRQEPSVGGIKIFSPGNFFATLVSPKDTTARYFESDLVDGKAAFVPSGSFIFNKINCPNIEKLVADTPWRFA